MQPFIKIRNRYINTAMITDALIQDQRPEHAEVHVGVYLAPPMGERSVSSIPKDVQTRHLHLSGDAADVLIRWLDAQVTPFDDA